MGKRQTSIGEKHDRKREFKTNAQAINGNRDDWEAWLRVVDGEEEGRADVGVSSAQTPDQVPLLPSFSGHSIVHWLIFRLDVRFNLLPSLVTLCLCYTTLFRSQRVYCQGEEGSGPTKPPEIRP